MRDEAVKDYINRMLNDDGLTPAQKKTLKRYDLESEKNYSLKLLSRRNQLVPICKFATNVKKPFEDVTRQDIEDYIYNLEGKKPSTLEDYKLKFKKFFKWLYQTDGYPEVVKWIKIKNHNNHKLPEDILKPGEVKTLIEAADNIRDRAIIALLYESGCRLGEITALKQKDVKMDQYGAVMVVSGKTGQRRIRLIESVPYLIQHLNNHPNTGDNVPLFVNKKNPNIQLHEQGIQKTLAALSKRALGRHIHPHLLRHSRLTQLAKDFTESELKIMAGWTGSSRMPAVYVHLSGADIEKKILERAGLIDKEEMKKDCEILKPLECARCKEVNPATAMFCFKCGAALTLKTAMKVEEDKSEVTTELMTAILQDPGVMAAITKAMQKA
ncbi:MAG: site-specific integrase [ANME-2 cluster archaeon]|nr:site-specific integrase [ANME-2 cluster archaeon]